MDREIEAARALARASSVLERASGDVSLAQYRILTAIASGHRRASQVADALALGRPAVTLAVDAFCRRGLVSRLPDAGDQRATALRLTPEGEALLAQVDVEMRERIGDLCRRTPNADRMLDALIWLGAAVDERRAEKRAQQEPGGIKPPKRTLPRRA